METETINKTAKTKIYLTIPGVGITGNESDSAIYLIRRNLEGMMPIDSIEFQSTSQSKLTALKQLLHTIVLADEAIAPYCERILNVLESTLFTWEEKEFTDVCLSVATALGVAVDSKIYIPLLLKHMQNDVTKASIKSLKIVMMWKHTNQETLIELLPQVLDTLNSMEQIFLDSEDMALMGASVLSLLVESVTFAMSKHSASAFNIHLSILSSLKQDNLKIGDKLSEDIARSCGYSDSADMYSAEVKDIMDRWGILTREYTEWNKASKDRYKFEVIIRHCKEGIAKYIEIIINILASCTEPSKDAELRFDMLAILDLIVETEAVEDSLRQHAKEIGKRILIQSMLWKSGKPNIKIRKAAILVFTKMLNKNLFPAGEIYQIYSEIIAPLKDCLEDDWAADLRMSSIHYCQLLITTLSDYLDTIELSNLRSLLLYRLDDAQDAIRIETTVALRAFLQCKNMTMSESTFEYVIQTLFIHLDDKNEDVQVAVFKTLEAATKINPAIVLQEAKKSLSKQKFPRLCEKIIEIVTPLVGNSGEN